METGETLYKPHAEDKVGSLHRQKAIRRKGNTAWNQTLSRTSSEKHESKEEVPPDEEVQGKKRKSSGSSLDLAPTLLSIYDNIAAGSGAPEKLVDTTDAASKSKSLPASVTVRHSSVIRTDSETNVCDTGSKMADHKEDIVDGDIGKKRPLSISSSSSASSTSLSRPQRKRPNLADYEHLLTSKSDSSVKNGDLNGNCQYSKEDGTLHEGMEGVEEMCSQDTSPLHKPLARLKVNRNNCPSSPTISPSPTISSPDFSPEKSMLFSSKSSPEGSDSLKSPESRRHSAISGKSPPSSPGEHPSSPTKTSPGVNGSKDSPEVNKGSLYVSYVQRVVAEIVDTERIYVKSLEDIIHGYLELLENSSRVKQEDIKCLFSNIREIYEFGRVFLWELEQCEGNPVKVAECFVTNNKGFVIYTDYCTNYPSAVEVLTRYMKDPELSEMFKQRQHILGHGLPLGAYLLRPVQRILKYHLLLQNILKFFDKEKEGYDTLNKAFKHMTEMAHHINEMKRKHEHAVRIQEIQSQLEDYEGQDLTRLGELVLEGPFRVYGAKASRQVFLFEREILISKKKEGGMLGCKSSIQLANLMLVEVIPNEPLSFHLIPFDNPRAQFTLQARNMEQKRRWCQEIKRLILDTYKGKIPDKVKSLVMELGRNHDNDYVNSENLDPRKNHHTAPEYLEKRRGRRKSGGRIPGMTDFLKTQKAKRGSSGTRKDVSPKTSPTMERRRTHPNLLANPSTPKKDARKNVNGTENRKQLPTTRSNTGLSETANKKPQVCKSLDNLDQRHAEEDVSGNSVLRAKSFKMATRMRPINSQDLGDVKIHRSDSDSDDDTEMTKNDLKEYSDVVFGTQSDLEEASEDDKPKKTSNSKHARYSSMPVLNTTPPNSPRTDPTKHSTPHTVNVNSTWNKKQNQNQNQNQQSNGGPKRWNNVARNDPGKRVPAFHDTFSKKSLAAKSLRHPVYNVKHLSMDYDTLKKGNKAKLTSWGSNEKLTKGSMSDLSHLSEDPWVKNPEVKKVGSVSTSDMSKHLVPKVRKDSDSSEHKSGSRENLDWMVYVNRNSLNEKDNQMYLSKYCANSKGTSTPPKSPLVKDINSPKSSPKLHRSIKDTVSINQSRPVSTYDTVPDIPRVSLASSVPSIVVSSPRFAHPPHLNRSNSIPLSKLGSPIPRRQSPTECDTYTDSEKMVAEMEDYMKHSESQSSLTYKFPTNLPALGHLGEHGEKANRHSTISTSSYDSHSSSSSDGIMDTLKHKFHNLTSRISRKLDDSDTQSSVSDVRPSSMLISDDEKLDDGKSNKESSTETIDSSHRVVKRQLDEDEELRIFLRERGLGGGTIGSRMANSLPPNVEALISDKLRPHSACVLRDNESVSSYEFSSKETTPEPQPRLSLPIMPDGAEHLDPTPLSKLDVQQSDSGFSMQSDITDTTSTSIEDVTPNTPTMDFGEVDRISNKLGEVDRISNKLGEVDRISNKLGEVDRISNKLGEVDRISNKLGEVDRISNKLGEVDRISNKLGEVDRISDKLGEVDRISNKLGEVDRISNILGEVDRISNKLGEVDRISNKLGEDDRMSSKLGEVDRIGSELGTFGSEIETRPEVPNSEPPVVASQKVSSPMSKRRSSASSVDSVDSFYERRLSMALDADVFRDSAVFCDGDLDQKPKVVKEVPKRPRRSIKDFVHMLEERNRPKPPTTFEVKRREPGSVIRERLHTLQQVSQYSRNSSRNTSEERELLPPKSVKDIQHHLVTETRSVGHGRTWFPGSNMASINSSSNTSLSSTCSGSYTSAGPYSAGPYSSAVSGPYYAVVSGGNQFMHHRAESECGRESSPEVTGMRAARSLGRLDQLSNEIENLVIMKGWVRSLINKFQE